MGMLNFYYISHRLESVKEMIRHHNKISEGRPYRGDGRECDMWMKSVDHPYVGRKVDEVCYPAHQLGRRGGGVVRVKNVNSSWTRRCRIRRL